MKSSIIDESFNPKTSELYDIINKELHFNSFIPENTLEYREFNFYNTQELILRRAFLPTQLSIKYLEKINMYRISLNFTSKSLATKALDYLNNNINIRTYSYSETSNIKYHIHFLISSSDLNQISKYYD